MHYEKKKKEKIPCLKTDRPSKRVSRLAIVLSQQDHQQIWFAQKPACRTNQSIQKLCMPRVFTGQMDASQNHVVSPHITTKRLDLHTFFQIISP